MPSTIYVLDDDLRLLRLIGLMLDVEGFRVRTFSSGWDFLAGFADEARPDLIVLDLMMPEMDGIEVLKRVREIGYDGRVMILSAYGAERARKELGADTAIAKPFEPEQLVETIRAMVEVS